jgi:hypothetical protein
LYVSGWYVISGNCLIKWESFREASLEIPKRWKRSLC